MTGLGVLWLVLAFLGGAGYVGLCWWLSDRWWRDERVRIAHANEELRAQLELMKLGGYFIAPDDRSPRNGPPASRS